MEVHTLGTNQFTWRGPKWNGHDSVFRKLDYILCNVAWRVKYHEGFSKVIPRTQSDHHPFLVMFEGGPYSGSNHPFRFEATLITHVELNNFVGDNQEDNSNLIFTLSNLTPHLKNWNNEIFGNIFKRKSELLARLNGIKNNLHYGYNNFLDKQRWSFQDQLAITSYQDECFWFQKSRSSWILDGDRNTKYYHSRERTKS